MSAIDALLSFQLTLLVHASVLLALAWGLERTALRRRPAWAELAWRGALFGALLSSSLSVFGPVLADQARLALAPTVAADPARAVGAALPGDLGLARRAARADVATAGSPGAADRPARASAEDPGAAAPPAADTTPRTVAPATAPRAATAASGRGLALTLPRPLAWALLLPWAIALALAALRLVAHWRARARWSRRLDLRPAPPGLHDEAAALAYRLDLPAPPALAVVAGLAGPLLLDARRLLLPDWAPALAPAQRRALLAHELAHVQRRDPGWRLAQRAALLPLALHPLAWLALRRLEALAEDDCDARAAALCGDGRALAECLAVCLRHAGAAGPTAPALALAMADEPGPVVRRVRNLLEYPPMNHPLPARLRRAALVVAITAAVALPGLAITTVGSDAVAGGLLDPILHGSRHTESDGRGSYAYRNVLRGESLEMSLEGGISFTEAEDDVATMADGAEFEIEEDSGGVERSYAVEARDGKLERDYRVDGKRRELDAEGRAWLARVLPHVMRETGMQARERAGRILARKGVDGLLDEMDRIGNDYSRGKYLAALFALANPDDAQMARALRLAAGIDSDYEMRMALEAGLAGGTLSPARRVQLLGVATGISSDYEQAELLLAVLEQGVPTGAMLQAWSTLLESIGSDYDQRRVLQALLATGDVDASLLALAAAKDVSSDYEARQLLAPAAATTRRDPRMLAAYANVLATIGSDYEQRMALEQLVGAGPVDVAVADAVLASLPAMGSDHEVAEVLVTLAAAMPADPALVERYRAAARRLGDFERGRAERALDRFAIAATD